MRRSASPCPSLQRPASSHGRDGRNAERPGTERHVSGEIEMGPGRCWTVAPRLVARPPSGNDGTNARTVKFEPEGDSVPVFSFLSSASPTRARRRRDAARCDYN
jgi:hypothetical protein